MVFAALMLTLGTLASVRTDQSGDTPRPQPVSITVVATDRRGDPVAGLKPGDFAIRDNGTPQQIQSLEFKRGAARLFAVFLDEFHVTAGPNTDRARAALLRFVDQHVRPGDRLIVMKPLDQLVNIRASDDRDAARRAIEAFAGCKGDFAPRTPFEAQYMSRAPQPAAAERSRVVISDLSALIAELGRSLDAPTGLLVVTEGPDSDLVPVSRVANRAGVPVYVLDAGPREQASSLRALAADTGGAYEVDAADNPEIVRLGRDLDGYYVLTFRPAKAEGGFHRIELSARRRDVDLRARRGYWAPMPAPPVSASRAGEFSMNDLAAAHSSNLIRPWFRLSRGPQGRTRVTFSWQPSDRKAPDNRTAETLQLTASTPDGTAMFTGVVASVALQREGDTALTRAVIDVPPGRLRTEMMIADARNRVLDRDVRFLEIPDLYSAGLTITPPEILRTRTVREFRTAAGDPDALPTVSREFNRFERLLVRVRAYGPGEARPDVTAALVNALGQRLRDLGVVDDGADGSAQFDLLLSPFARGSYAIEITAHSGASKSSQIVPIRIIG